MSTDLIILLCLSLEKCTPMLASQHNTATPQRKSEDLHHLEPSFLLILASFGQLLPRSSVAIPPIPPGEARLWFYRDGGPYEIQASPYLRLNGRVTGIAEPDGVFYREVAPRHY